MPIAPASVLIGRSAFDLVNSVLDLVVLVRLGLLLGWSSDGGVAGTFATIGLLLLLRFAMIWAGIWLGQVISQEAAGLAWAPLFPLTMIANTFVAPSQMPGWLGPIAGWNPISATVTATRQLFGNPVAELAGNTWPAQNALLLAVLWPLHHPFRSLFITLRNFQPIHGSRSITVPVEHQRATELVDDV